MLALVADPPRGMVVVESLWNCDRAPSPNPALGCRGLVNNESTWHAVPRTSTRTRRGVVRMAGHTSHVPYTGAARGTAAWRVTKVRGAGATPCCGAPHRVGDSAHVIHYL